MLNLEILAHPTFNAVATTAERFSGWVGHISHQFTNRAESGIADNFTPGSALSGIDRANPNAIRLVPDTSAGAPVGRVKRETGFALYRADGSTAWFAGSTSPQSLSTRSGNTLTHRDFSKSVFDTNGQMIQTLDPQGNSTTYTYDGFSRLMSMVNPTGGITSYTYTNNGVTATTAEADNVRIQYPDGTQMRMIYNRTAKTMQVTYSDSAGVVPAPWLGEGRAKGVRVEQKVSGLFSLRLEAARLHECPVRNVPMRRTRFTMP